MYAELVMIKIGPGMRPMAEKVAHELSLIYKAMKVFRGVYHPVKLKPVSMAP